MRSPEKEFPLGRIDRAKFLEENLPAVDQFLREGNTAEAVSLLRQIEEGEGAASSSDTPDGNAKVLFGLTAAERARLSALRDRIGEVVQRCEATRRSILEELGQLRNRKSFERADEITPPGSWLSRQA